MSIWNNTSLITTLKNFFPWRPRILIMTIRTIKTNFVPPIFAASQIGHSYLQPKKNDGCRNKTWNTTSLMTTLKNFFPWRPRILSMTIRAIKANFVPPIFPTSVETHRRRLFHPSNLLELLLLLQNLHQITKV